MSAIRLLQAERKEEIQHLHRQFMSGGILQRELWEEAEKFLIQREIYDVILAEEQDLREYKQTLLDSGNYTKKQVKEQSSALRKIQKYWIETEYGELLLEIRESQVSDEALKGNIKRFLIRQGIHHIKEIDYTVRSRYEAERGKMLAPSSMASEVTYYNNIREFLIDRKIQSLDAREEEKIIRMLKGWMLERGYALSSKKYRPAYDKIGIESPSIVRHMKKILKFLEEEDGRDEQEKDIWTLKNFDFPIYGNPIKNTETINFTKIVQPDIREEVKKVIFMHLKYSPLGTIHSEMAAVKRFSKFLKRKYLDIQSLQDLERMHIEEYLIYLQTEAHDRKNYRSDLYALRRVIEDVGNLYERQYMSELFLSNDFPSTPRHVFKFYSDAEIKRLNEHIFKMDEQICRALIIHQLLGTRISDTLTLKTDCLSMRNNRYFIRIDQVKSVTYEKAISEEVAQLIMKAIDYTKERYGETTYIFAKKDDPTRPYQYSMIQNQIMTMIRQEDIRDDNGEFLKFGTHIFRHCYGKKLTEMHVDDWMIAKLLGHTSIYSVHHYRKIGNKLMADETRAAREKMDMILLDIIEGWDDYEI